MGIKILSRYDLAFPKISLKKKTNAWEKLMVIVKDKEEGIKFQDKKKSLKYFPSTFICESS